MPRRLPRSSFVPLLIVTPLLGSCEEGGRRVGASVDSSDALDPAPAGYDSGAVRAASPGMPRDSVRVVFLGTSLTSGLGLLRDEERYTDRIQARAAAADLPVRVVNAGVSGETSAGGLRRLDWALDGRLDVLVVELGANDGLRGHDPEALESNLRAIVQRARERRPDIRIVLMGMEAPPNLGATYTAAFRRVFQEVARDLDLDLVPFLLEGVAGVDSLNQEDGMHPNPAGHERMARNTWRVLRHVLEEEVRSRATTGHAAPGPADPSGKDLP